MSSKSFLAAIIFLTALCTSAGASVTEIRHNFFQQTADLAATPIMSAPLGEDGSYLIAIYESANSPAPPTLRWTDENGASQSKTTVCNSFCQLLTFIRVEAGTRPTVETNGFTGTSSYSLYVTGLGFWPSGAQGQGGLSEVTRLAITDQLVYTATSSISGLLVAYSDSWQGQQYFTWWDEYGERTATLIYESPMVIPIRIAGGTGVRLYDITQPSAHTHVWYSLILFGAPSSGPGPFIDHEYNMLDWTNASYPNWQNVFTNGASRVNVLMLTNIAENQNSGSVDEILNVTGFGGVPDPCPTQFVADTAGDPASCVVPLTVLANTPLQVRTVNQTGSPWGKSPKYSAEIDVLQF